MAKGLTMPAALFLAALLPRAARAALSVMPHQSDGIVMLLRSAIMLDEKDLSGPLLPTACSSLEDGPYCERFSSLHAVGDNFRIDSDWDRTGAGAIFLSGGDQQRSAQFVVDGVLSNRMQTRNREAFDWQPETYRTFSTLVSRVISESLSSGIDTIKQGQSAKSRPTPASRSGSQCFRILFNQVPPGQAYLPENFSAGLPRELAPQWEGFWEMETDPTYGQRGQADRRRAVAEGTASPWATRLVLRTALGYLRFPQPVVIRRLLVGVPLPESAEADGKNGSWGRGGLLCGRLKQREQWCVSLDQVAAARAGEQASAGEEEPGRSGEGALLYADVGNSIHAVDEVAVIAVPPSGLRVALVEVAITLRSHPRHNATPAQRRVVLLRHPPRTQGAVAQVEPVLVTVSRDAAIWDMNEVLDHHMLLRVPDKETRQRAAKGKKPLTAQKSLHSFQVMLQGLRSHLILPPPGVTFARLKREVGVLVSSTKEIQDDDVLLHSKIETLLQQRLREKGLDGLIALQAAWARLQDANSSFGASISGSSRSETADRGGDEPGAPGSSAEGEDSSGGQAGSGSVSESAAGDPHGDAAELSSSAAGESQPAEWADVAAHAMQRASAALEKKSAEVRRKQQKFKGKMQFQMHINGENIQLQISDSAQALQELVKHVSKAMGRTSAEGGDVAGSSSGDDSSAEEGEGDDLEPGSATTAEGGDEDADADFDSEESGETGDAEALEATVERMLSKVLKNQAGEDIGGDAVDIGAGDAGVADGDMAGLMGPEFQKMLEDTIGEVPAHIGLPHIAAAIEERYAKKEGKGVAGGEDPEDDGAAATAKKPPLKMQVFRMNLDQGQAVSNEQIAQMMQSVLAGQQEGSGGLEAVPAEQMQAVLQAAFQEAQQHLDPSTIHSGKDDGDDQGTGEDDDWN